MLFFCTMRRKSMKKFLHPLIHAAFMFLFFPFRSDIVRGYSFLERSAWPEIVTALETGTQHIFNPGNPTTFHQVRVQV